MPRLQSLVSRHICGRALSLRGEAMNIGSTRTALWFQEQERTVRRDFWAKLKHFAGQVPFVEDVVAAYYCALDPATPMRVRGILLARGARLLHLSTSCATA